MWMTLTLSLLAGLASLGACVYGWRKGQFRDAEDVKYQIFRDE